MNSFDYYSPTYFVFGRDREAECGKYVKRFGGSKVLVVYGASIAANTVLLEKIHGSLRDESLEYLDYSGVPSNPRSGVVYKGIELCRREGVDFLLAVGGGSTIDACKAIAIGVPYEGDFWDFFSGKTPKSSLGVGVVLTLAASGSEGSPNAIITNEKTLDKTACEGDCVRPRFAVMDPQLTTTLPPYQTACGITDIISHCLERYFTTTENVEATDRLLEGAVLAMMHEARTVMANPKNYDARANIMWCGMVSHNEIMGVGRQQDWTSHHLEHVMSALFNCAHGAGMAVILPAWMSYCIEHGDATRFVQFAVRVLGCDMDYNDPKRTARQGVERFKAFLREIGMPLTLQEIGIGPEDIPRMVEMNHVGDRPVGQFCGGFDREAHFKIYQLAAGET